MRGGWPKPYQYGVCDIEVAQSGKDLIADLRTETTVPDDYKFSRVPLLAVDAWRYGPRDDRQQFDLQQHLEEALSAAAARSGLDRSVWRTQDAGDGLLALLPDSGSEPLLVDPFIRELDTWLARRNHDLVQDARLRLRIAVHHGPAIQAQLGYASGAVVHVCRLRDSQPVRDALNAAPEANLVLAVSALVFEDVIRQRHTSLSASDFTKVEIADEAKKFTATAWLRVPGIRLAAPTGRDEALAVGLRFLVSPQNFPRLAERVLVPSFAAAGIALPDGVSFSGDCPVICLPGVSVQEVLGLWLHHLDKLLESSAPGMRMAVGVCTTSDRTQARELASSDTAARVLAAAAARGGLMVVVVPGYVHETIMRNPGRLVRPETYVPADTSSWLRVLGHAKPRRPADRAGEEPGGVTPSGVGSVNAYGEHGVAIGKGKFRTFVVGTVHRHDGSDR